MTKQTKDVQTVIDELATKGLKPLMLWLTLRRSKWTILFTKLRLLP